MHISAANVAQQLMCPYSVYLALSLECGRFK